MDRIESPLLQPEEVEQALFKIIDKLDFMKIKYGIIGSTAVGLFARHHNFPHRQTSKISILIQPKDDETAEQIGMRLCGMDDRNFCCWIEGGQRQPKVYVKRPVGEYFTMLAVKFKLLDFRDFPKRMTYYDFRYRQWENEMLQWNINGKQIRVVNAPWLLKQKIIAWVERDDLSKRPTDEIDIRTLRDVLEVQEQKVTFWTADELKELTTFVSRANAGEGLWAYRKAIFCPQVLGPWWDVRWIRWLLYILAFVISCVYFDRLTSDNTYQERQPTLPEILWGQ